MANFLADIGRSNMLESVSGTISAINSMRQTDAAVALGKEQIERLQRQNLAEKQEYEEGEREIALETFDVLGGPDGKIAQDMFKLAKGRGFINTEMNSIKAKHVPVMKKLMSEPRRAIQLGLDTIAHWRNELVQINEKLKTKPKDQKLLQDKDNIKTALNAAMGRMPGLQAELKRRAAEAEAAKDEEALTGDISQFFQMYGRKPKNIQEIRTMKKNLRLPPQTTVSERDILKRQKATKELTLMAQKDPNKVYAHGYKMNADGTLYIDPVDKAPVKLPHFTKVMGKRGGPKMAKAAGEFWDDTVEIQELLNDSEVIKNLQWAEKEGFWDRVKGSWSNKINLWLTKKGFSKDSKTTETVVRMQRLASIERLKFLGSAVTATELESILPWLPSAGDSFSTMTTKMGVAAKEGEEAFRRYLEMYQDICDMSPFYKAFGFKRFPDETNNIDALKSKYGLE